ncbi:MAG: flagellar filament capping protein FliD [bacterium]|mgnify:CR=1 FL=1|nr:flagellar filament capping protein FliD [bacterium]
MPVVNFSGLASGIDTEALIKAIIDSDRQVKIKPLEKKVTEFTDENAKLDELKTLLKSLKDIGDGFRTVSSQGGALTKNTTSSDETVATATADNDAFNTSFQLTVTTLASNGTASFNNTFADTSTVINSGASPSSVVVNIGTGTELETTTLNVDNTTTVAGFVTAFNEASTKAIATAVNVGTAASPSYKIMFSSLNEGTLKGNLSITDASSFFSAGSTIQNASNATFSLQGITGTITRSSNSVSDVIPGVTIQLNKGGALSTTITVGDDVEGSIANVQTFVDKYNEIVAFVYENNLIVPPESTNGLNTFSPLSKSRLDDNTLSTLRTALSSVAYTGGSQIRILADIGITTQQDGTLKFNGSGSSNDINASTFSDALAKESESVQEILNSLGRLIGGLAASGGVIDVFTRFQGLYENSITTKKNRIDDLNIEISDAENVLTQKETTLRAQFSRFESLTSRLQQQQSSLSAALGGLGN